MSPLPTTGSPASPAFSSAISVARVASCATRPMVRRILRVYCGGSSNGGTGPPRRVLSSAYRSHSCMRATPLTLARNARSMVGQSCPIAVMPPKPVTTTLFSAALIDSSDHSAVDPDDLAGDVSRVIGHQKVHHRRDLAGLAHSSHRDCLEDFLDRRVVHHVGADQSWSDAVDGDPAARQLYGQCFGGPDNTRLGRAVIHLAPGAHDPRYR